MTLEHKRWHTIGNDVGQKGKAMILKIEKEIRVCSEIKDKLIWVLKILGKR